LGLRMKKHCPNRIAVSLESSPIYLNKEAVRDSIS
jgi:hypothetical protein